MDPLEQLIAKNTYKEQLSEDFVQSVMLAIFLREEKRFRNQIILSSIGLGVTFIVFFYILISAISEAITLDLYEYIDLGVQNPDIVSTSEWQTTIWEALPIVEIGLLTVLGLVLIFLIKKSIHLISSHFFVQYAS